MPERYALRALHKDGRTIWLDLRAAKVQYKGRDAIMGYVVDVTDRKAAEEALEEEARRLGLVNRVVPHERLMEETTKLARRIASRPSQAVRMTKRAVYDGLTSTLSAHLDTISSHLALLSETEEHREAVRAFLAKGERGGGGGRGDPTSPLRR